MAMSGYSKIDINRSGLLEDQDLVYDWLAGKAVRWRVYHDGLPFFSLMPNCLPRIFDGSHFRSYNQFRQDVKGEPDTTFPQVIFIEPRYTSGPHLDAPVDDHPPTPIANGQAFLGRVYGDLASNPARWRRSVLVVTYDEHGAFFDHVSPPRITTEAPAGEYPPFDSLGVRVPALIISPWVRPRSVYHGLLDHTSILKFIAWKFGGGKYSPAVDQRGVGDMTEIFDAEAPRNLIPYPPMNQSGFTPENGPVDKISDGMKQALAKMKAEYPEALRKRFPDLWERF
jgi:phospholipase C